MSRRLMAVWFPRLGAERWLRLGACPPGSALVTVSGTAPDRRIDSLTAAAEAAGLMAGQRLRHALDLCPHLVALPADVGAEARLMGALTRAARWLGLRTVHPPHRPGMGWRILVVELRGGSALPEPEEAAMARAMTEAARLRLSARPGIADTPTAACALARHGRIGPGGNGRIAPPGRTRVALAPLPVAALSLGPAATRRLGRLGVHSIGEISDLPPVALRHYLGHEIACRIEGAFGDGPLGGEAPAAGAEIVPLPSAAFPADSRWRA